MFQNSLFQSSSLRQHSNRIQNKGFTACTFKERGIRRETLPGNCTQLMENSTFPTILTHEPCYLLRTTPGRACALNPTFFFRETPPMDRQRSFLRRCLPTPLLILTTSQETSPDDLSTSFQ